MDPQSPPFSFVTLVPFIVLWLVIGLVIWMVRGYLSSRR